MKVDFDILAQDLPTIIVRSRVQALTGGIISGRTLANHDSKGTGPKHRQRINGKVCYPRDSLIEWLQARSKDL